MRIASTGYQDDSPVPTAYRRLRLILTRAVSSVKRVDLVASHLRSLSPDPTSPTLPYRETPPTQ